MSVILIDKNVQLGLRRPELIGAREKQVVTCPKCGVITKIITPSNRYWTLLGTIESTEIKCRNCSHKFEYCARAIKTTYEFFTSV